MAAVDPAGASLGGDPSTAVCRSLARPPRWRGSKPFGNNWFAGSWAGAREKVARVVDGPYKGNGLPYVARALPHAHVETPAGGWKLPIPIGLYPHVAMAQHLPVSGLLRGRLAGRMGHSGPKPCGHQ